MAFLIIVTIVIFALVLFVKAHEAGWKGKLGERFVSKKLLKLDPQFYRVLADLMLPSDGNSTATQIDRVVVSNFGIFCIETKSYRGWIFGDEKSTYWTQVIYRHKERFYNPLRQNFGHIKAIEKLLGQGRLKSPIRSFIVFPQAEKLKISGTDVVGTARDTVQKIAAYSTSIYSDTERDDICTALSLANITDKEQRNLHNGEVRGLHAARANSHQRRW